MRKLLIAGLPESTTTVLAISLSSSFDISTALNVENTQKHLAALQPDALIIGHSLLQDIPLICEKTAYKPSAILLLTDLAPAKLIRSAERAGIDHIILLPSSPEAIRNRLILMLSENK